MTCETLTESSAAAEEVSPIGVAPAEADVRSLESDRLSHFRTRHDFSHYGEAHSAAYDAERTAELFCEIVNRWKECGGWLPPFG